MKPEIITTEKDDLRFTTVCSDTAIVFTFEVAIDGDASPSKVNRVADALEVVASSLRRETEARS